MQHRDFIAKAIGSVLAVFMFLASPLVWSGAFSELQTTSNAKHSPVITAPDQVKKGQAFEVKVTVGAEAHPSTTDHFIRFITLLADDVEVARASLTPTLTRPEVTFVLTLDHSVMLKALAAPNHSAAWVATREIKVVDQ